MEKKPVRLSLDAFKAKTKKSLTNELEKITGGLMAECHTSTSGTTSSGLKYTVSTTCN